MLLAGIATAALASPLAAQCAVVLDLQPGTTGSYPEKLTPGWGNVLFFTASSPWGTELFKWDPVSGAGLVADINPGQADSRPHDLAVCCTPAGPLLFFAATGNLANTELWVSDGSSAGTHMVAEINPGIAASNPAKMAACDDRVFFSASDGTHGGELWVSDGTAAGTTMVLDINPGSGSSNPADFHSVNGRAIFTAWEPVLGRQVYVTDGTAAGTTLLWPGAPGSGPTRIEFPVLFDGRLHFGATDAAHGNELWSSDGTSAGTVLVADLVAGPGSSFPMELTECNGMLFFTAVYNGRRLLYRSDGTAGGTVLVDTNNPLSSEIDARDMVCSGDRLFYAAQTTSSGRELYVSDGTAAGTGMVAEIQPAGASSYPQFLAAAGEGVCFQANGANNAELWFSDGTAAGTREVCDLDPGAGYGNPMNLTLCHGRLFFSANSPAAGNELHWVETPGATQATLGEGGRPSRPELRIDRGQAPILGRTIAVAGRGPANHVGLLTMGLPLAGPPLPVLMDGGCDWVGLLTSNTIQLAVTSQASIGSPIPVPNQLWLTGVAVHLQAFWLNPAGQPLIQASNGVQLVIGGIGPS